MSAYVSLGRNVTTDDGTGPMSEGDWHAFVGAVRIAVEAWAGPVCSVTFGTGYYEGKAEETAIIVGETNPRGVDERCLRLTLAALARVYRQDCIALTVANPEFIAAQT